MLIPLELVSLIAAIGTAVVALLLTMEVELLLVIPVVLNKENVDAIPEPEDTLEVMVLLDKLNVPKDTMGTIKLESPLVLMIMLFDPAIVSYPPGTNSLKLDEIPLKERVTFMPDVNPEVTNALGVYGVSYVEVAVIVPTLTSPPPCCRARRYT
jgi:hypothetical protein